MSIYASYGPLEQAQAQRDQILYGSNQPEQYLKDKALGVPINKDQNNRSITSPLSSNFNGNANLHALYPDEFEYYACAFELLDSKGETEMYLVFPIMPNSISENLVNINNVEKTLGGIVINNTPSFMPVDINLSGTFGRKFKYVSGLVNSIQSEDSFGTGYYMDSDLSSAGVTNEAGSSNNMFNKIIKTGYGLTKILKKIYNATSKLDAYNKTRTLLFYNLALNSNYVVEPRSLNLSQSNENNMMWQYNMSLKAVAPVNTQTAAFQANLQKLTNASTINKKINESGKSITKILQDQITSRLLAKLPDNATNKILKDVYNAGQTLDVGDLQQFQKSIFTNTLNKNKIFS